MATSIEFGGQRHSGPSGFSVGFFIECYPRRYPTAPPLPSSRAPTSVIPSLSRDLSPLPPRHGRRPESEHTLGQILPLRIHLSDQKLLLLSAPTLQLLLSRNRIPRIVVRIVVHKTIQIVSFREPGHVTRSMLMDPTHPAVRDSDIQRRLSLVGHHVNVKPLAGHEIPRLRSE